MKSMPLKAGAAAVSFGLLTCLSSASALALTTATETEVFDLSFAERTFQVSKGSPEEPVVSNVDPSATASQTLTFDKFNSALGSLQGVTMVLQSNLGSTVTVTASLGVDETVSFFANGDLSLLLTGPGFITDLAAGPLAADASCLVDGPEFNFECSDTQTPASIFNADLTEGALSSFIGTGTFVVDAKLTGVLTPSTTPDNGTDFIDNTSMSGSLQSRWNGSVSLFYTYDVRGTSVSEPITLVLLGAAAGAAALIRRRRQS